MLTCGDDAAIPPALHCRVAGMAQLGRQPPDTAKFPDDVLRVHDALVRTERTGVNLECVPIGRQNAHVPTTGEQMRALRERSGLTMDELATLAGYARKSSIQRYVDPEYDGALPINVAANFARALEGRGDAAISAAEVLELAGIFPTADALREMFFALMTPEAIAEGRETLSEILARHFPAAYATVLTAQQIEERAPRRGREDIPQAHATRHLLS